MEHALDLNELARVGGRDEKWSKARAKDFNAQVRKVRITSWACFIEQQYQAELTRHQIEGDVSSMGTNPWTSLHKRSRDAYLLGIQAPCQSVREALNDYFPGSNEIYIHVLWGSLSVGTPVEDLARIARQRGGLGQIDSISDILEDRRLQGADILSPWMDMAALLSSCARLSLYLEQRHAPFRYSCLLFQVAIYLSSFPGFRENAQLLLHLFRKGFGDEVTSDGCTFSSRSATYVAVCDISRYVIDTAIFIAGGRARLALTAPISLLTIVDILHPYVLAMASPSDSAYGRMMELLSRSRQPDLEPQFVEARNELEAYPVFGNAKRPPSLVPKKDRRRYFSPLS